MPAVESIRRERSRKDRPCDACRRAKHTCQITVRGEPCRRCARTNKVCTFDRPAIVRHGSRARESTSPPDTRHWSHSSVAERDYAQEWGIDKRLLLQAGPGSETRSSSSRVRGNKQENVLDMILSSFQNTDSDDEADLAGDRDHYPALDLETNDLEESLYLGAGAFSQLTMDRPTAEGTESCSPRDATSNRERLIYRQVANPERPVYFLKNPSKVYGMSNLDFIADKAFSAVSELLNAEGSDTSSLLFKVFLDRVLPTLPIVNRVRLEGGVYGWKGASSFPRTLMVGIAAYTAIYVPTIRHKAKELWGILLHLLDNAYRQPRLHTLQIALLDIYGRPSVNSGGNHPALLRAIGVAQLLGLHRDCSQWRLPRWERSVRKRLWWSLFIADKWYACVYGRPFNLPSTGSSVAQPTLSDDDWRGQPPPGYSSLAVFVAQVRLAAILETLLPFALSEDNLTVDMSKVSVLPAAVRALKTLFDGLDDLAYHGSAHASLAPGQASFQLDYIAVQLLVCRLAMGVHPGADAKKSLSPKDVRPVLELAELSLSFLNALNPADYYSFWAPWSTFHLTHLTSLLLHLAQKNPARPELWDLLRKLVNAVQNNAINGWEVAETALPRIRILIRSMPESPQGDALKELVAPPPDVCVSSDLPPVDLTDLLDWDWLSGNLESMMAWPNMSAVDGDLGAPSGSNVLAADHGADAFALLSQGSQADPLFDHGV